MIALLQRVAEAAVLVNENLAGGREPRQKSGKSKTIARIGPGTLALIGVQRGDGPDQVSRLLQRVLNWRMFDDDQGKMNLNLAQAGGSLLLVPQFTLAADTDSGNRPSFTPAAPPTEGRRLFDLLVRDAKQAQPHVESGIFGADMDVRLVNDGPVTFWLQVKAGL
jgi:D-tyrosyl-tRNA(Tyr) deacylase